MHEWLNTHWEGRQNAIFARVRTAALSHRVNYAKDPRIGPHHPESCELIRDSFQWAHRRITNYQTDSFGRPLLPNEGGPRDQIERERQAVLIISGELARLRAPTEKEGDSNDNPQTNPPGQFHRQR